MWAGFFCRQDVSISIFGRTKEFSEVRGTSLMYNFGVRSRCLDVIYAVRPPNGSPVQEQSDLGPHCFVFEASNSFIDDKKHTFVIMLFKGY